MESKEFAKIQEIVSDSFLRLSSRRELYFVFQYCKTNPLLTVQKDYKNESIEIFRKIASCIAAAKHNAFHTIIELTESAERSEADERQPRNLFAIFQVRITNELQQTPIFEVTP